LVHERTPSDPARPLGSSSSPASIVLASGAVSPALAAGPGYVDPWPRRCERAVPSDCFANTLSAVQLLGNLGVDQRAEQLIRRMEEILRDVDSRQGSGAAGGAAAPRSVGKSLLREIGGGRELSPPD
jgi:hypothetical protein